MISPPRIELSVGQLPSEGKLRHEALVAVFGQYVLWMRDVILSDNQNLVELPANRRQLGALFRGAFERMASLEKAKRDVAYDFAQECVDGFARELLRLLANSGFDLALDDGNVVRFRLVMEICNGDTGEIIVEEVLNRGGRHFPDNWGRWLNRYKTRSRDKDQEEGERDKSG